MKKLLLLIIILVSYSSSAQLAMETFSGATFPPTGWTTANTNPARPWGLTTTLFNPAGQLTYNINGPSAAITWIATVNDAHLTTPAFSLATFSSATLEFKARVGWSYMIDLDAGDLFAQVSTNGGGTWIDVWQEEQGGWTDDGDGDPDSDLYDIKTITVNLDSYAGQANVLVRFRYLATDADTISIDDVRVFGTLGVNEVLSSSFSTFPNPVNDVITLTNSESVKVSDITISDINGRTIRTVKVDSLTDVEINVADLNAGVYLMNINSDSGKAVKKFIKN